MKKREKLGEVLLRAGVIDQAQLTTALGEQERWGGRLGVALVKLGFVSEHDLVRALASQLDLPVATLDGKRIPRTVLNRVSREFADEHSCLPLFVKEEAGIEYLYLGMDDPLNLEVIDDLSFRTGLEIRPVMVAPSELCEGIDRFYRDPDTGFVRPQQAVEGPGFRPPPSRDTSPFEERQRAATPPEGVDDRRAPPPPPATSARLDELRAPEGATPSAPDPAQHGEASPRLIVRALIQLMIEKGLIDQEEFATRVRALQRAEAGS